MAKPSTISEYIAAASPMQQKHLRALRTLLKSVAPKATEALKWGNPVFEEGRILFAFAAYKNHLNFMPTPAALKPFKADLKGYKVGKGSISFPYDKPLPGALIKKIATHRLKNVRENDARWM